MGLVQDAESGDKQAQHIVDAIGWMAMLVLLASAVVLIWLIVWAIVFTINGGDWAAPTGGLS